MARAFSPAPHWAVCPRRKWISGVERERDGEWCGLWGAQGSPAPKYRGGKELGGEGSARMGAGGADPGGRGGRGTRSQEGATPQVRQAVQALNLMANGDVSTVSVPGPVPVPSAQAFTKG